MKATFRIVCNIRKRYRTLRNRKRRARDPVDIIQHVFASVAGISNFRITATFFDVTAQLDVRMRIACPVI